MKQLLSSYKDLHEFRIECLDKLTPVFGGKPENYPCIAVAVKHEDLRGGWYEMNFVYLEDFKLPTADTSVDT